MGSQSQKMLQEFLFLSTSPCCQLHTCSFTSSPPLIALSACRPDSQDGCSIFSQHLPLFVPPERDTAGKKPPSTTMLQSTTSLRFTPLSKHLFYCAIATKSPGRLQFSSTAGRFTQAAASGEDLISNSPCSVRGGSSQVTPGIPCATYSRIKARQLRVCFFFFFPRLGHTVFPHLALILIMLI